MLSSRIIKVDILSLRRMACSKFAPIKATPFRFAIALTRLSQLTFVQVEELDLEPITSPDRVPVVVHGTYSQNLPSILKTGLSRMKRNHIHFAQGHFGDVRSGTFLALLFLIRAHGCSYCFCGGCSFFGGRLSS